LAIEHCITRLDSITKQPVTAQRVVRGTSAGVQNVVAGVHGTDHTVVTGTYARLAVEQWITRLRSVAEQSIVAQGVVGSVGAGVQNVVAGVDRTGHAVAARSGARLAIQQWVACFCTIAKQSVIAGSVNG